MIFNNINGNNKKNIITVIIIIILIIANITVIAIMYKKNDSVADNQAQKESVAYINNDQTFAGDSNILFVCNGEDIGDTIFAMIMEFKVYSETINLTFLDMNSVNNDQTYNDSYKYGGIDSLIKSVEEVRSCTINRYMIIDKAGIGKITDKLGSVNIYVSESFTYAASDKNYEIAAGNNDLESDALYTYLSILSNNNDSEKLNDTVCEIIKNYITKINAENSEMIFGEICNSVTTNITITDYYTSKEDFNYLLSHNPECYISDKIIE